MKTRLTVLAMSAMVLIFAGCSRTYDTTTEIFGKKKKDVLVDRIAAARDAQSVAKDQFAAALDEFRSIAGYKGTLLEDKYNELNAQYKRCQSQTNTVDSRLADVRRAAKSLFRQWDDELEQYSSTVARRASEEKLRDMEVRYENLMYAMGKVSDKFYPALAAFKDQVLLVRHNLNTQMEMTRGEEMGIAEQEISVLIQEIDRSMGEADTFIRQMRLE